MKLAFVIPAYNEEALIGKCLESVVAEIARSGADAEIIVVNNASTDRTGEIARSFPGVRVVDEPKKGLVNARDAGFAASEGFELIANIDSDTIVPAGWLDTVLREFGRDPKLVCLSGPYVYYDMSAWNRFLVEHVLWPDLADLRAQPLSSCALARWCRAAISCSSAMPGPQVGGYDRSIEFFGEDTDVAVRLSKVGGGQVDLRAQDEDLGPPSREGRRVPHGGHLYAQLLLGHLPRQAGDQGLYRRPS